VQPQNPYAPPQAMVQDIPVGTTTPADRGIRLAASILDGIVAAALVYAPFFLGAIAAGVSLEGGTSDDETLLIAGGVPALVGAAGWCWLTIRFVLRNGQTIGKRMVGIKVVRNDGSRASFARIFFLRNAVPALLGAVTLNIFSLIDVLFIFSESRQCLHDKIADTIVIQA
jgi:uncharacterized RDD family membrane protein YckC